MSDNANGEYKSDTIRADDDDIYALDAANPDYVPSVANVDVIDGGIKYGVKTYIIVPPTICEPKLIIEPCLKLTRDIVGVGEGLYHRTSIQVPALIRAAIKTQRVQYIGKGLPVSLVSS